MPTIIILSPKDDLLDLYFAKVATVHILVVVNRETKNVVTARNMIKNEKRYYNMEIKMLKQKKGIKPLV